jgi:hypothetical protein
MKSMRLFNLEENTKPCVLKDAVHFFLEYFVRKDFVFETYFMCSKKNFIISFLQNVHKSFFIETKFKYLQLNSCRFFLYYIHWMLVAFKIKFQLQFERACEICLKILTFFEVNLKIVTH